MAKSDGRAYFRRSSLFWIVTVTLLVGYYTWAVFWPEQIPYESLGLLGTITKYLVDNHYNIMYRGWWTALGIHFFEAFFALKICSEKGIENPSTRLLWFIQTLLFGFGSLGLLLKYKPDGHSKQH